MKKIAACLVVSAFTASTALGGTVAFDLVSFDANTNVFDVSVGSADFGPFTAVTLVIGSPTEALGYSFDFDQDFLDSLTSGAPSLENPFGLYGAVAGTIDLSVGGTNTNEWTAPLLVGQLTVDVSGLRAADTMVQVDTAWEIVNAGDMFSAIVSPDPQFDPEGLQGMVKVPIPEPATLMLLGLGGLAVLRRRKA